MQPGPEPAPEQFGPYVVMERLGLGGLATVFRAKKHGIEGYERNVALKRMLSHLAEDAQFVESFVREAKVASLLVHPNIAQVYDFGRINGVYYIAMELVVGFDLRKLLRHANRLNEPIPMPVILSILTELCDALEYAHTFVDEHGQSLGIIHRDVSPSNLIVAHTGHLKVIDFGIAKAQSRQLKTDSGQVKGKLGYMSPEAALGYQLGPIADVFSAGVVAWELITSLPLFSSTSDFETMRKIREMEIPPPSQHNTGCTKELDDIVLAALDRDPEKRMPSAGLFRRRLDKIAAKAGIQVSAHTVADWMGRFPNESGRIRPPSGLIMPLPSAPRITQSHVTQNLRPSKLNRTREEAQLATEIWGEDANTVGPPPPGPDFSSADPAPAVRAQGTYHPAPAAVLSPPPPVVRATRSKLPLILLGCIGAVGAAIAVVVATRGGKEAAPAGPTASVTFTVSPANAIIDIGGKEVAHTSPFEAPLAPGLYSLGIHAEGYKRWTRDLTLRDGEHPAIDIALERAIGHVAVEGPQGKQIYVDGKNTGATVPATIDLPAGPHHVTVGAWERDLTAMADETQTFTATQPPGSPPKGQLVASKPDHHHHATTPTQPHVEQEQPKPDPIPDPPKPDPKPDPVPEKPVAPPPPPPKPPAKPARTPLVQATEVTKVSGELPQLKVHGDANGDVLAKVCIDETGRVTSAKAVRSPAEITNDLQQALLAWRYKPYVKDGAAMAACFALSLHVVVKHDD